MAGDRRSDTGLLREELARIRLGLKPKNAGSSIDFQEHEVKGTAKANYSSLDGTYVRQLRELVECKGWMVYVDLETRSVFKVPIHELLEEMSIDLEGLERGVASFIAAGVREPQIRGGGRRIQLEAYRVD